MSHLQKIFEIWGGNAEAMAADIGESGVKVRQWRNRGSIHSDHWPKIIRAAAEKRGVSLRPEDFWPAAVLAEMNGLDGAEADSQPPFPATSSPTSSPTSDRQPSSGASQACSSGSADDGVKGAANSQPRAQADAA